MKTLRCSLCGRALPELEPHDYPFTACDDCFDEAVSAARFVQFVNVRREMDEARARLTAWDLYYKGHTE